MSRREVFSKMMFMNSVVQTVNEYVNKLALSLERNKTFDRSLIEKQWFAFRGEGRQICAPVIDLALGPFAISSCTYEAEYNSMSNRYEEFISNLITVFQQNWEDNYSSEEWRSQPPPVSFQDYYDNTINKNSRCFIAIEIENHTNAKHLMGSIVNAGALGRLGLLVAWNTTSFKIALRMREYFDFLKSVGKTYFNMDNVLILKKEQLAFAVNQ